MTINLQKKNASLIMALRDGEEIEFIKGDLASIGIGAGKTLELIKNGMFESHEQ